MKIVLSLALIVCATVLGGLKITAIAVIIIIGIILAIFIGAIKKKVQNRPAAIARKAKASKELMKCFFGG
jgi:hypothetical protein